MKKRLNYFIYLLWWLGIINKCPKCNSELIRMNKGGWDLYKCSNDNCDFGKKHTKYRLEIWKH